MPTRNPNAIPRIVRLLAINAAGGVLVGCAAAGGLLMTDAGGLATLFAQSGSYAAGGALLFGGFALTFGSLAMASAIMLLPRK
ncbi:MAG: hypothetical protein R3D44_03315 [Hyphomicrobiaceae bacterium]